MNNARRIVLLIGIITIGILIIWAQKNFSLNTGFKSGDSVDSLNQVYVFYNGKTGNVSGRNTTNDAYNLGLKYQCVEFVKRYYYKHLNHKMPNSYGHAKDFFDHKLKDGQRNMQRNLIQCTNSSKTKPQINDIIIFKATTFNKYGHVAIVSLLDGDEIEIIQQNPGRFGKSRQQFKLIEEDGSWEIDNDKIVGWLRKN